MNVGEVFNMPTMQQFKADFFKALAHPLRIQLLEVLSKGDKSVSELQELMNSECSAVSQQLSILRAKNIVIGRKHGKSVIYSLRDPSIVQLLEAAREIFNNHLIDTVAMLEDMEVTSSSSSNELG